MNLIAYLGTTGLVDVGFRFFDAAGAYSGARVTSGVVELPGARGVYWVPSPTVPGDAVGVYWDSTGTAAVYAYELFSEPVIRGAVGLASANLDTQLGTLATATELAKVPRQGAGAFIHTNTVSAETASVAIT